MLQRTTLVAHDFSRISPFAPGSMAIQRNGIANPPGDIYDHEADAFAERVIKTSDSELQGPCACGGECEGCETKQPDESQPRLQAKPVGSNDVGRSAVSPLVHEVLASPGQRLDPATRAFMESRFGHDFSRVRVHVDAAAEQSARDVNAHAYTVGSEIVFGKGRFTPRTEEGRRLIAHELTHVVQQAGGGTRLQREPAPAVNKSAQFIEDTYRSGARELGDPTLSRAADDVSRCREPGGDFCDLLVTDEEIDSMHAEWSLIESVYDRETADRAIADHNLHAVAQRVAGVINPAAATYGAAFGALRAVAPSAAPVPAAPATMLNWTSLGAANSNVAVANSNVAVAEAVAAAPKPIPVAAVGVSVMVVFGIFVTVELWKSAEFQKKLFAAGYKYLPSPRGVCMRGCHQGSTALPDGIDRQRTDERWQKPLEPYAPLSGPLSPADLDFLRRADPASESEEDRERRRRKCPPIILLLPRAKSQDFDAYAALIGQLEHVPNRPRDTNQRYRWAILTPGRIPGWVWVRAALLGLHPGYVVFPFWGPRAVYTQTMQVDHDIEMQVTPIGRESEFDTSAHHRLMDAASNTGAGAELAANIVKMREALVTCTNDIKWMTRPMRFERIASSTSSRPGIWTRDDLIAGRHLDAYERLGRPAPP